MGYTRRQRLLRVELPLALPLIIAGVRLATVTTIGLATVAADPRRLVRRARPAHHRGPPDRSSRPKYLLGAVLSVGLAFVADFLLVRLERPVTPWARVQAGRR